MSLSLGVASPEQPVASVTKTLAKLCSIASNRSCADCRVTLIDSSQVHASFNPKIELPSSQYNNFRLNHVNFAPPNYSPSKIPETLDPPVDPSLVAASYVGGHGVFVCALCGAAHKLLGRSITVVYAVQDSSTWSVEEVQLLVKGGGNNRARSVLEAHIPHSWKQKRPNADSTIADRLTFVRAKYEALAFVLPPSGPFANRAWRAILDRHQDEWEGNWGADLHSFSELQLGESHSQRASRNLMQSVENGNRESILPNRLVDYFCVVTPSEFVIPDMLGLDLSELSSPEDVLLVPEVTDCFPNQEAHADTEFPKHIGSLVVPDGCRPSLTPRPPSFFSFVLTCGDGVRLYGGALCLYDNDSDVENLKEKFRISGYEGQLPGWMGSERSRLVHDQDTRSSSFQSESDVYVDVVYFPKVLVVVSHYPFFDVWRKFLLQIYRIALVGAPLPIERFIANFVGEVPLPPPGKILVKFGLTVNDTWSIGRPPENQLPLADFSFQPLFAALSVSNVMVVIGCLLEEGRVALLSRHYAMLAPTAEALVSLLFPFHWQGMYLPVLPYNMIDILGAPVPFLVGLHSRYLVDVPAGSRPRGVVFVDLDRDVIHLGYEYDEVTPRSSPALPERQALKLKSKLETHASVAYVECDSVFSAAATKAATILTGNEEELHNSYRDPYARASKSESCPTSVRRKDIFGRLDRAYADNELQVPISGFLSEHGQFYEQDASSTPDSKGQRFKFLRAVRPRGGLKSKISADSSGSERFHVTGSPGTKLLDKDDPSGFDSSEIRNAFLRLFVSIFQSYRHYLDKNGFRSEAFIDSLNCSERSSEFLHCVVKTQFFSRFLDERIQNPSDPEIRFFDESIIAKINRSKKQTFSKIGRGGGKRETSFLKDDSNMVNETFTPPPPSNWGLPDDGRTYHYGSFPALNPELFGKVRRPMKWPRYDQRSSVRTSRRISALAQANEKAFVARALKPVSKTPKMLMAETKRGVKNLDTALSALSSPFVPSSPMRETNRERRATGSSDFSMSDISLSSALVMRDDIVSTAEGVVLNARRKQAILLGIIIKLQTHCRLHLVLKKDHQRESFRVSAEGDRSNLETNAIICLQKWYRVLSVGRSTREWFRKLRFATCRMQSLTRDRMVRAGFLLLVTAICRAQARIRGFQTRKIVASIVEHRLRTYREHIFLLWKASHTPLSYRCKFWPILKVESYLRVQMAEAEVHRLWSKLNIPLPTSMKNLSTEQPKIVKSASLLRMNFETHWACIILNIEKPILILDFSQKGNSKVTAGPEAQRINSERVQIYDRISALKLEQQLALFDRFSVPLKGKRKKLALAVSIWHATKLADESTALMLTLFTELNDSTNINFKAPTKKSLRRFPPSPAITPLKRALWAHVALEDRIRLNTLEVARIGLHDIPRLSHKVVGNNAVQTSGKNRLELMRRVLNCGASGVNTGETKSLQARHLFKPPAMFNRSHASKSDSIREVE